MSDYHVTRNYFLYSISEEKHSRVAQKKYHDMARVRAITEVIACYFQYFSDFYTFLITSRSWEDANVWQDIFCEHFSYQFDCQTLLNSNFFSVSFQAAAGLDLKDAGGPWPYGPPVYPGYDAALAGYHFNG